MKQGTTHDVSQRCGQIRPHRTLSLVELVTLVVNEGNRHALNELIENRPVFRFGEEQALLLPEYLHRLWQEWNEKGSSYATEVFDKASDITMDKFSRLSPETPAPKESKCQSSKDGKKKGKKKGINCREYYGAFLEHLAKMQDNKIPDGQVRGEYFAAGCLQRLVSRHFYLSYLEAKRTANPFISRFEWKFSGRRSITILMPKFLHRSERSRWLEKHVDDPNPARPGEKERVQAIINERLVMPRFVPLNNLNRVQEHSQQNAVWPEFEEEQMPGFAEFLAKEKGLSVDFQKQRAIRDLGSKKLERLVLAILENMLSRTKTGEQLAKDFGISKTALSRFAGRNWNKATADSASPIPALWRNAAELLGSDPVFVKAAGCADLLGQVKRIMGNDRRERLRGKQP